MEREVSTPRATLEQFAGWKIIMPKSYGFSTWLVDDPLLDDYLWYQNGGSEKIGGPRKSPIDYLEMMGGSFDLRNT